MKVYRIKMENKKNKNMEEIKFYVRAIMFETNPFSIECMATIDVSEAGIYEENKAKTYCEELNNNPKYKENNFEFSLESVGDYDV